MEALLSALGWPISALGWPISAVLSGNEYWGVFGDPFSDGPEIMFLMTSEVHLVRKIISKKL